MQPSDVGGIHAARILRDARLHAGLTQQELATATGLARTTIARIETGASDPHLAVLDRLLAATGLGLEVVPRPDPRFARETIRAMLSLSARRRLLRILTPGTAHFLQLLGSRMVRYLIVGRAAAAVHGAPIDPGVLDVWIDPEPSNANHAHASHMALTRRNRGRETVRLHRDVPGGLAIEGAFRGAVMITVRWSSRDGLGEIRVASIDDLVRMSRAGRDPRDHVLALDPNLLWAVREERDRLEARAPTQRRSGRRLERLLGWGGRRWLRPTWP